MLDYADDSHLILLVLVCSFVGRFGQAHNAGWNAFAHSLIVPEDPTHIFVCLCRISLSLLHLLERFHRSVQSMSVVSSKLGICALERRVSVGLWLLDAIVELKVSRSYSHLLQERSNPRQQECVSLPVLVSLLGLVVLGRVL